MLSWVRQPTSSATTARTTSVSAGLHEVGERTAGEHRAAGHGQRAEAVDEALVHVVGDARAGARRGEGDGLGEDAGHQELAVDGRVRWRRRTLMEPPKT